jgi:hypothetical protein
MWRHRSWPSATQGQSALTRYQLFWYLNLGLHNFHHYEKQVPVALATKSVVFFLEELELTRCLWGERRDQKWGCVWGEERLNVNLLPCILCVCVCVCVCVCGGIEPRVLCTLAHTLPLTSSPSSAALYLISACHALEQGILVHQNVLPPFLLGFLIKT